MDALSEGSSHSSESTDDDSAADFDFSFDVGEVFLPGDDELSYDSDSTTDEMFIPFHFTLTFEILRVWTMPMLASTKSQKENGGSLKDLVAG